MDLTNQPNLSPRVLRGRHFFANPGPTNIPDSVLRAMDRPSIDYHDPDFQPVYQSVYDGLKRVLGTRQHLFMYTGSGHAAWEATLANLLSPGDTILVLESGFFSEAWAQMARALGLEVRVAAADWRRGVEIEAVRRTLAEDATGAICAVCVVHNETATGVALPLTELRAAIDATGHGALLLVDTISSLASLPFQMDAWRIDAVVGGSQKGLMCPTAISFTGVSEKAIGVHRRARLPRFYFDWDLMLRRGPRGSFVGTVPVNIFYGLRESLRLIEEEGLERVIARHAFLAEGVRRAVRAWSGNGGPQLFCEHPARCSDSVTAVLMPEGHDPNALRQTARKRFNVSLGGGLGRLDGRVFRIGHMGDLNEPMVLGALSAVEMSLRLHNVPHGKGGVEAAMDWYASAAQ